MTSSPSDSSGMEQLTPNLTLRLGGGWQGGATLAAEGSATLSPTGAGQASPLSLFELAGPAIELQVQQAPAAVLSGEPTQAGALEFRPGDDGLYVLMQTIETDGFTIYDFTLPQAQVGDDQAAVLGAPEPATLRFAVNPVALTPPDDSAAVLGVGELIGGVVGNAVGDFVRRRALQLIKAPVERLLLAGVARAEGEPRMLALRGGQADAPFQPLEGAEAWRALLPPGETRRALLFLHGFASSTAASSAAAFLPELAAGYDAVLSYDHPTLSRDPLRNAADLLAQIPEDLRLSVDIIGHCRGGLVARSLAELIDASERCAPRAIVTVGTPHHGTELVNPEKWDRLISLTMTAASWLATLAGVAAPLPKILEWVLRAAAQGAFGLPGVAAMAPADETFLAKLNAAAPRGQARYAAVTSRFSLFNLPHPSLRQTFEALAAQSFFGAPNDLLVATASMAGPATPPLPPAQLHTDTANHWGYFQSAEALAFIREQLR